MFRERYIQKPSIFRTRGIFRIIAYLKLKTYLIHCQTSKMERFAKKSYLAYFLIFREIELCSLSKLEKRKKLTLKMFFIFREMELSSLKLKKPLIFQEGRN